jgi:hypothetical protein
MGMAWMHSNPRLVPSAQELSQLPAASLATEITNIELVIANRYAPNGSFAELCDGLQIDGRAEQRAFWADLTRYRANLYTARNIQALETQTGGIGMLDIRTKDNPRRSNGGYCW